MKAYFYRRYPLLLSLAFLSASNLRSLRAAEDDQGSLNDAKEPLGKLIALELKEGRLVLDQDSWSKHQEEEPQDPEAAKNFKKAKMAKEWGVPIEQITDAMLKMGNRGGMGGGPMADLFRDVMASGGNGRGGSGSGMHGTHANWDVDGNLMKGHLEFDSADRTFGLKLTEKGDAKRILIVSEALAEGLTLRLENPKAKTSLLLVQSPDGPISLVARQGKQSTVLTAETFDELLKSAPDKIQLTLLRPLAKFGIALPPAPFLPTVMAAATSGYGAAAAEAAKQADLLIAKLSDEDMDVREQATQELTRLFPQAIRHLEEALKKAGDEETKLRLNKVSAAHPGIAKAKPFVLEKKLHEDRAYLLEILAHVPFFKAAARTRLAELYGKDYGEDPAAWPPAK